VKIDTTHNFDEVRAAVVRLLDASFALVAHASDEHSAIPLPFTNLLVSRHFADAHAFLQEAACNTVISQNKARAFQLLTALYADWQNLLPLFPGGNLYDIAIASQPIAVDWCGVRAPSPVIWVVNFGLDVMGAIHEASGRFWPDLSGGRLNDADADLLAGRWNAIRALLRTYEPRDMNVIMVLVEQGLALAADRLRSAAKQVERVTAGDPQPQAEGQATAKPEPTTTEKVAQALALMVMYPDKLVKDISQQVDLSIPALYKDPKFRQARKAMRGMKSDLARGKKDRGKMEAWDEDERDE
jgi:hypothetical protein